MISSPWARYSKKLMSKIENTRSAGLFTEEDAEKRGMRLAVGSEGALEDGSLVKLYFLVDPLDGLVVDAKFQAYGGSALLGIAEASCQLVIGKNYDQVRRISAEIIDQSLRDHTKETAIPWECAPFLNQIVTALFEAADSCEGLPLPSQYVAPPAPMDLGEILEGGYPGWDELKEEQQRLIVEEVLNRDIRPYIALDAGGVELIAIERGRKISIRYQGNCTSCMSSVGATLSYIQEMLRRKVHPELEVNPLI